jgi:isoquinoline 1-oxidoreductase subunit alpha
MSSYSLNINGKAFKLQTSPQMPLLWVLRDSLGLTGTKFGCGKGFCGACIVHADGQPTRACITPIEAVRDKAILTIEGLSPDRSHPLQLAWKQHQVSQCGYCQSGQIMAAAALLDKHDSLSEAVIEQEMDGVLCRCGSYQRIKQAILSAARQTHGKKSA